LHNGKHKRILFYNDAARIVIYSGGIAVIIAVLGILVFIFNEAFPLFSSAETKSQKKVMTFNEKSEKPLIAGVDEYEEIAFVLTDSANIDFIDMKNQKIKLSRKIEELNDHKICAVNKNFLNSHIIAATENGEAAIIPISFSSDFDLNNARTVNPEIEGIKYFTIDSLKREIKKISVGFSADNLITIAAMVGTNEIHLLSESVSTSLLGEDEVTILKSRIIQGGEKISAIELDAAGNKLAVGTDKGFLYLYSLENKSTPVLISTAKVSEQNHGIPNLKFLLGDQSIVIADEKGNISSWMLLTNEESGRKKLERPHVFSPLPWEVNIIAVSQRDKSFIVVDKFNNAEIKHLTSAKTLANIKLDQNRKVRDVAYSPKANGALLLYEDGLIEHISINAAHAGISTKTLFGKVWYEGYAKPEYVWQSTGGTDDFEPKFSLIPLIFGTL